MCIYKQIVEIISNAWLRHEMSQISNLILALELRWRTFVLSWQKYSSFGWILYFTILKLNKDVKCDKPISTFFKLFIIFSRYSFCWFWPDIAIMDSINLTESANGQGNQSWFGSKPSPDWSLKLVKQLSSKIELPTGMYAVNWNWIKMTSLRLRSYPDSISSRNNGVDILLVNSKCQCSDLEMNHLIIVFCVSFMIYIFMFLEFLSLYYESFKLNTWIIKLLW